MIIDDSWFYTCTPCPHHNTWMHKNVQKLYSLFCEVRLHKIKSFSCNKVLTKALHKINYGAICSWIKITIADLYSPQKVLIMITTWRFTTKGVWIYVSVNIEQYIKIPILFKNWNNRMFLMLQFLKCSTFQHKGCATDERTVHESKPNSEWTITERR